MPPKRRRPAAEDEEAEGEAGKSDMTKNLRLSARSTAVPGKRSQLTPLAAKHTTSYGSPAPVLPTQGQGAYGSDLKGATRDIFAAVRKDQKRAKLSHEISEQQPEQRGESSRPGLRSRRSTREPSVQESARAVTPEVIEEEEEEEEEEGDPWLAAGAEGKSSAPTLAPAQQQASDKIEAELRRLQANREAREAEERKEKERADRKERDRARKEEKERADRERAERERAERERAEAERLQQEREQERIEKEQRQRARREEKERADREREERKQRERQEREDREHSRQEARERAERAEREHQERIEREETERAERAERERSEREARERAEEEEQQHLEQEREDREYRESQEAEQAMRAKMDQQRAARAEADRKRAENAARAQADVQGLIAKSKRRQEEENAALERRQLPGPHPNLREQFSSQVPQKRDGQEFLDDLFISPKRPRNNDQTPAAAYLRDSGRRYGSEPPDSAAMSTRSFIEESSVFRDANVRTPGASSVIGNTPSRLPVPGSAAPRAPSLGPVADDQSLALIAQMAAQRSRQGQHARATGSDQQPAPSRPDFAPPQAPNQPAFPSQPVSANPLPPPRQADLRPRPVSSIPPPAPGGSSFLPRPQQPARVGIEPPRLPHLDPESDDEPEEPEAGPSRSPRRSSRLGRRKNTPKPDPAPHRRDPAPRSPPRPPVEDEPGRPDRDSSSDPSSPSDDGSKDGPRPPRKQKTSRLRRDQNRPVRDGVPPRDDPPPDDDTFAAQFEKAWNDWKHYLWLILRWLGYFLLTVAVSSLMMHMWSRVGSSSWENNGGSYGVEWYGWSHMGQNIGQFIPYDLRHPLGFLNDAEYNSLRDHINTQDRRIFKLTDQNDDLRQTTQKLESILPKVVSVKQDKKTSKLVIGQDFWHALKDLIHKEKSILTLDRGKDGKNNISEEYWSAVLQRLKNEGVLSRKEVDGIVNSAVSTSWENWLKNNKGKVDKVLPGSSGQPLSADAEKKLLKEMDKLVREKVSGPGLRDVVVTRDEFIREIQNYMRSHKREADASLAQVQDSLKDMILAAQRTASQTGGMSREEVISLTNDLIHKAISNARLEGTAKGSINSNLRDLSRRINYFAFGNGATIDVSFTSPSYESPAMKKPPYFFGTDAWLKARATSPRFIPEQAAALRAWDEAGHCWCAGAKQPSNPAPQPADINVRLARPVAPTNIVMEHVDPATTLDPLAMPKDMEVWVMMDDPERLIKAKDFMFSQFPDTARDHPLLTKWYVKIGEFRYEHDPAVGGVYDYQVNDEWGKLGITTDLVLVRATSNYGADHTCFYRVRLYGNEVEGGETEE